MGVGKINLSKPTFLILFLVIAGIGLTIGAASAVMVFSENLVVDNGAGDSSVNVTSATGDSKVIVEDQGLRSWSISTNDGKKKFQIVDETTSKPRFTIKANGLVGIGVTNPSEKLDVNGNIKSVGSVIADDYVDTSNNPLGTDGTAIGGSDNTASGDHSTVGGGQLNSASVEHATVGGGAGNIAEGDSSTVGGGKANRASGDFSTVGGGGGLPFGNGASGIWSTASGGRLNHAGPGSDSTVGGGRSNHASGVGSTIGGGDDNTANSDFSTVGGGESNLASDFHSTVGGGDDNTANSDFSTVGGGELNSASGDHATTGGGESNVAGNLHAKVGGGKSNEAYGIASTIGGGFDNIIAFPGSVSLESQYATIGGGNSNNATGDFSTIGGGASNKALGDDSTIAGGRGNDAGGVSAVGGGQFNDATGNWATIPGGLSNDADGDYSFATGRLARANNDGAKVFGDSSTTAVTSFLDDQFFVQAGGGTRFFSKSDLSIGVVLAPNSNAWGMISDTRLKDNISEYSVLDKLDDYRAVEFDWKAGGNHDVGVMAQELQSIFPELVNSGSSEGEIVNAADPGVWSVQYGKLGALALQAIKEQQTIIDSLISIICEDNPDREICLEN